MDDSWPLAEVGFMLDSASLNNNIAENQVDAFYESCFKQMSEPKAHLDNEPQGIVKLEEYKKHIIKKIKEFGQTNNSAHYLWKVLLENISNPHLQPGIIDMLMVKTNQNNRQVRDFFRNQRKRSFIPIETRLNADIDMIMPQISVPDPHLMNKINSWCNASERPKEELDIDSVLAFPRAI